MADNAVPVMDNDRVVQPGRPLALLRQAPGRLGAAARLLAAAAVVGGAAGASAWPVMLGAVLLAAACLLASIRSGGAMSRQPGVGLAADVVLAAAAAGLVARAASPAFVILGVAASLPLVAVVAFEHDRPAGIVAGLAACGAGAVGAWAAGHYGGIAASLAVAPVAVWLAWMGASGAALETEAELSAAEVERVRREMVTTVSHELRTPLTVIQGVLATLSRRWDVLSEPERMDLIDVVIDNTASLDSSILHFVDAGRLERGAYVINPEWVDVAQAVQQVRGKLTTVLAGHPVTLDASVPVAWVDRVAFLRIVEHLLVNAVRFSSIGLPITIRTALQGPEVVLSVTDRGQGIPPHLLTSVWTPLERGDVSETGVSRGAGLGLPIVRELARLHGGDADLQSSKARGTTVIVRLPLPPDVSEPSEVERLSELPKTRRRARR